MDPLKIHLRNVQLLAWPKSAGARSVLLHHATGAAITRYYTRIGIVVSDCLWTVVIRFQCLISVQPLPLRGESVFTGVDVLGFG